MKRILNKRISVDVKTLLTMLLVGVFCVSVMSATPVIAAQIQATIASHIISIFCESGAIALVFANYAIAFSV